MKGGFANPTLKNIYGLKLLVSKDSSVSVRLTFCCQGPLLFRWDRLGKGAHQLGTQGERVLHRAPGGKNGNGSFAQFLPCRRGGQIQDHPPRLSPEPTSQSSGRPSQP